MKKFMTMALLTSMAATSSYGQDKPATWINNVKLSGYAMTQYQYSDQEGAESNSFNLRLGRVSLEGRAGADWYWKAQIQFSGNTSSLVTTPKVVDLFAEWQKYSFLYVRVGQFKRPFTFENPIHPIEQGFMGNSQVISKLAGFADRTGMQSSNGRDIGVQLQGDFLKNAAGRNLLHYQVGVFNGQGVNTKDVDRQKDLIGGVWVMPVAGMRIGVFGSEGSYSRKGSWTNDQGNVESGTRKLAQHRYAISGEYKFNDWTIRSEYVHSTGQAFKTTHTGSADQGKCDLNESIGNKADGAYAQVMAPVIKQKLYAKARYDMYRPSASWSNSKTLYEVGANYYFHKNVQLNVEYALVNDRALAKHNYNIFDVQLDVRF